MAFDLSAMLKDVSGPDTGKQQIQYIDLALIDPNPDNFYSLEGLDELAGSIEMLGLQQPLLVRPAQGGRYTVISGHRRRAALMLIRDGGSQQFADGVPCIVDRSEASAALQELKLIMANSDTRKMSSADQNTQAERIEDLLRQLVDEGFEFPGRRRDWVAKLSGMSRTKLARLKVIRDKLDKPLFTEKYQKNGLGETAAYALAQQPVEMQRRICDAWLADHKDLVYMGESFVKLSPLSLKKPCSTIPCIRPGSWTKPSTATGATSPASTTAAAPTATSISTARAAALCSTRRQRRNGPNSGRPPPRPEQPRKPSPKRTSV